MLIGIKPKDAIRLLRQKTDIPFLYDDIYNIYKSFKRQRLNGLAVTNALIEYLEAKAISYAIKADEDNRTRYLFIAHPRSLELARRNPDIAIADCTYQTNQFNLPLLYMIGM